MRTSIVIKALLAATAAAAVPLLCNAESNLQTGGGTLNATAHVDFQITIPQQLYLRVGTGSAYPGTQTSVTTIDEISFAPAAGTVGNNTPLAATAGSGDQGNGVETAAVIGNGGTITLVATNGGAITCGGSCNSGSIAWTQITTTATTQTTGTILTAPTLANSTSNTVTLTPASGGTIDEDAKWTFTYANSTVPPAGTYGGVNTNNSRVTYTASMP
jgi:hypothetical protein